MLPPFLGATLAPLGCEVSETSVHAAAIALTATGLAAHGYTWLHLGPCWTTGRDATGALTPDLSRFPSGLPALLASLHASHLRLDLGLATGACDEIPATTPTDAAALRAAGVDAVSSDPCPTTRAYPPAPPPAALQSAIAQRLMAAAPLWIDQDVTHLTPEALALFASDLPRAIATDPLRRPATLIAARGPIRITLRPLSGGTAALLLENQGATPALATASWSDLGYATAPEATDIWTGRAARTGADGITRLLAAHAIAFLRLTPPG